MTKAFIVKQALKRWRKEWAENKYRHPITYEVLCHMLGVFQDICLSSYKSLLFWVSFSLAFLWRFTGGGVGLPIAEQIKGLIS